MIVLSTLVPKLLRLLVQKWTRKWRKLYWSFSLVFILLDLYGQVFSFFLFLTIKETHMKMNHTERLLCVRIQETFFQFLNLYYIESST